MGLRSFVKNGFKNNTNFKEWSGWGAIKGSTQTIRRLVTDLKIPEAAVEGEDTFEACVKRYGLSEADIRRQTRSHLQIAFVATLFGLAATGWTIYLFSRAMFLSGFVGLSLACLMFAYGFLEHFRYFQMKQRRLNCTFKEWVSFLFHSNKRKKA